MKELFLKFRTHYVLGLVTAFSFVSSPVLWAEQHPGQAGGQQGSLQAMDKPGDPGQAWATIQQTVKDMETAVRSKNLHGIHEPSMKIRPAIRTLKGHSSMLSGDKPKKISSALQQLDSAVTDLHSAADEGSQEKSEAALKGVEGALDQLKAEDPESAFKNMH
jgi:hypothetical protein